MSGCRVAQPTDQRDQGTPPPADAQNDNIIARKTGCVAAWLRGGGLEMLMVTVRSGCEVEGLRGCLVAW